MDLKFCPKCQILKELSEFYKNNFKKDNCQSYCKDCKHITTEKEILIKNFKKRCSICKCIKSLNEFSKNKLMKDGLKSGCKDCRNLKKKKYDLNNTEKINRYAVHRRQHDIRYRILGSLRSRINTAVKGLNKSLRTMFLIGCSVDYLMYHLQEKFIDGMSWDNYGDWHIDHKRPCARFDLSEAEEQRKCFHYSNLQPLWAKDNIKKKDNYTED